jgi:hypothetical protein
VSIEPSELENPERSLMLENREIKPPRPRRVAPALAQPSSAEQELAGLRERIAKTRKLQPERDGLHCRDCFERGRDATLRAIEGPETG